MSPRKKIFLVLLFIIQLSIIWPVCSLFSNIYPMILGLPLSLAWIVVMLFASFFLLNPGLRPFPMHEGIYGLVINIPLLIGMSLITKPESKKRIERYSNA